VGGGVNEFLPGLSRKEFLDLAVGAVLTGDTPCPPVRSAWQTFEACSTPADWARIASRGRWKLSRHLGLFNRIALSLAAREYDRVAIAAPPRHGKSSFFSRYLTSWWLGTFPDDRVIVTSYGAELATFWSSRARADFEAFGDPCFRLRVSTRRRAGDDWDITGHEGGMQAVGVGGPIMGRGANLAIVDDPFKNFQEARSQTRRNAVWEWFRSSFLTRLEPGAVVVVIMAPWHEDDLLGRLKKQQAEADPEEDAEPEHWKFFNFPALATCRESGWPDGLDRIPGDSLWPERYPRPKLLRIKAKIGPRWWTALYQGAPTPDEGDVFQAAWLDGKIVDVSPPLVKEVRFWDLAATEVSGSNDPDWTAGPRVGRHDNESYYVKDVRLARKTPAGVIDLLFNTAKIDGPRVPVVIEKEGGASGKIAVDLLVRELRRRGLRRWVIVGQSTGKASKQERFNAVASLAENGLLYLVRGSWNETLVEQFRQLWGGAHDDIADAISGAHDYLAGKRKLHTSSFDYGGQHAPDVYGYAPR
jgi:predicted phage terminase large subunit-like protein